MKQPKTVAEKSASETQQTSQEKRNREKFTKLNELFKTVRKQCNVTVNLISVVVKLGFFCGSSAAHIHDPGAGLSC